MRQIQAIVPPQVPDSIPTRLGWAVVQLWEELPKEVRARIKEQAGFVEAGEPTVQLAQQINIFIDKHAGKL
jgi:hypothetical protein